MYVKLQLTLSVYINLLDSGFHKFIIFFIHYIFMYLEITFVNFQGQPPEFNKLADRIKIFKKSQQIEMMDGKGVRINYKSWTEVQLVSQLTTEWWLKRKKRWMLSLNGQAQDMGIAGCLTKNIRVQDKGWDSSISLVYTVHIESRVLDTQL